MSRKDHDVASSILQKQPSAFIVCLAISALMATYSQCFAAIPVNVHRDLSLAPGSVSISGYISGAAADKVLTRLENGDVRFLVVNSLGGEELATIRIGEEIVRRNITLVVDGACMSGCADYLFLPALHRKIMPNSLVAFHHTALSLLAMLPPARHVDLANHYKAAQMRAGTLFAQRKLPLSLLLVAQIEIRTRCYALLKGAIPDQTEIAYRSQYVAWIPSRKFLKDSGIEFEGYWPETFDDLHASWARVFPNGGKGKIDMGGPRQLTSESLLKSELQNIPQCTSSNQ